MGPWRRLWRVGGLDVCSGQQRWALVCCVPLCCPVGRGGEGRSETEGQGLPATEPAGYHAPWPWATCAPSLLVPWLRPGPLPARPGHITTHAGQWLGWAGVDVL